MTSGLDPKAIEAQISDGMLTLHLPKPAQPKPRRIEIRPGSATGNGSASHHDGEQASGAEQPSNEEQAAGELQAEARRAAA